MQKPKKDENITKDPTSALRVMMSSGDYINVLERLNYKEPTSIPSAKFDAVLIKSVKDLFRGVRAEMVLMALGLLAGYERDIAIGTRYKIFLQCSTYTQDIARNKGIYDEVDSKRQKKYQNSLDNMVRKDIDKLTDYLAGIIEKGKFDEYIKDLEGYYDYGKKSAILPVPNFSLRDDPPKPEYTLKNFPPVTAESELDGLEIPESQKRDDESHQESSDEAEISDIQEEVIANDDGNTDSLSGSNLSVGGGDNLELDKVESETESGKRRFLNRLKRCIQYFLSKDKRPFTIMISILAVLLIICILRLTNPRFFSSDSDKKSRTQQMEQTDNDIHSRGTVVEERTSTNRYYDEENDKWIEEEYSYKRTEIEGGAVEDDED